MNDASAARGLFDLSERVFLIVGGARDLGNEIAQALTAAGACGAITSRESSPAERAATRLAAQHQRDIVGLPLDATDENQIDSVVAAVVARFGHIDILVNNVGGGARTRTDEPVDFELRKLEDWERLQRLNLTAPWLVARRVVPVMRKRRQGSIINIASIAGIVGRDRRVYPCGIMPQTLDYGAAKGGLIALTRDMAAYLGPAGIRVNSISPGGIERNQPPAFIESYSQKTMLGRMARGSDFRGAAVFLASDACTYMTAQNLVIDGGFSAWQ